MERSDIIADGTIAPKKRDGNMLPPYGKSLVTRLSYNNPPDFIYVCVGGDAFRSARIYNKQPDTSAVVLVPGQNPAALYWPVNNIPVIVEWDGSAPAELIKTLAKCLLKSGALSVTVWPTCVDCTIPAEYFDTAKQCFIQQRESLQIYYPKLKAVSNVHA
jgi:hypothetical protein